MNTFSAVASIATHLNENTATSEFVNITNLHKQLVQHVSNQLHPYYYEFKDLSLQNQCFKTVFKYCQKCMFWLKSNVKCG